MDWKDLADRLAEGAKVYKAFEDGANSASMLAGFERAHVELQARYDALTAQISQAELALASAKDEAVRVQADSAKAIVKQQAEFEDAHAQQVADAQRESDAWASRIMQQTQAYQSQVQSFRYDIDTLAATIAQLKNQIGALEQIKATLKSQLQGVA